MKNQREIYQALLDGKTIINNTGHKIRLNGDGMQDSKIIYNFAFPKVWEIHDKYRELRKALMEGAIIETRPLYGTETDRKWKTISNPHWSIYDEYRIKPEPILYYRWKSKSDGRVYLIAWYKEGDYPDDGNTWTRMEPGKTFEEI